MNGKQKQIEMGNSLETFPDLLYDILNISRGGYQNRKE